MTCDGKCDRGWVAVPIDPYYQRDLRAKFGWTRCGVEKHKLGLPKRSAEAWWEARQ